MIRKLVEFIWIATSKVCGEAAPAADDLSRMSYVGCVVKETLRMWPPAGTTRVAPKGSKLKVHHGLKLYFSHNEPALRSDAFVSSV
jgi:hypothetical protein